MPSILGFDPRYQFIAEDDISGVLEHATRHDLPGVYNAAGDGVLVLSEVASLLGKPLAPVLPPWGTGLAAAALRRAGLRIPPEMLQQLRYGRALDNRRLKAAGYAFRATSRETVQAFAAAPARRAPCGPGAGEGYQYEREVEEFLRWSPAVRGDDRLRLGRLSRDQLAELARALEALPRPARLAPRGTPADRRHVAHRLALLLGRRGRRRAGRRPVVGDVEDADLAERDRAGADELDHPLRDVRVELLAG